MFKAIIYFYYNKSGDLKHGLTLISYITTGLVTVLMNVHLSYYPLESFDYFLFNIYILFCVNLCVIYSLYHVFITEKKIRTIINTCRESDLNSYFALGVVLTGWLFFVCLIFMCHIDFNQMKLISP